MALFGGLQINHPLKTDDSYTLLPLFEILPIYPGPKLTTVTHFCTSYTTPEVLPMLRDGRVGICQSPCAHRTHLTYLPTYLSLLPIYTYLSSGSNLPIGPACSKIDDSYTLLALFDRPQINTPLKTDDSHTLFAPFEILPIYPGPKLRLFTHFCTSYTRLLQN